MQNLTFFLYQSLIWTVVVSQYLIWTTTASDLDSGLLAVQLKVMYCTPQTVPAKVASAFVTILGTTLCQTKICWPLAHLLRDTAGPDPFSAINLNGGLRLHGKRGGGSSMVFAPLLVSLISLVPGPVKTVSHWVWAKNQVSQVLIRNLNLDGHIFSTCPLKGTGLQCQWLIILLLEKVNTNDILTNIRFV